jgi:hypothetical protein
MTQKQEFLTITSQNRIASPETNVTDADNLPSPVSCPPTDSLVAFAPSLFWPPEFSPAMLVICLDPTAGWSLLVLDIELFPFLIDPSHSHPSAHVFHCLPPPMLLDCPSCVPLHFVAPTISIPHPIEYASMLQPIDTRPSFRLAFCTPLFNLCPSVSLRCNRARNSPAGFAGGNKHVIVKLHGDI